MRLYAKPLANTFPSIPEEVDEDAYAVRCPTCSTVAVSDDCDVGGASLALEPGEPSEACLRDFLEFGDNEFLMFCPACTGWIHMERDRLPSATNVMPVIASKPDGMLF